MSIKDYKFDFDAAIEEFFNDWPGYRDHVFVAPNPGQHIIKDPNGFNGINLGEEHHEAAKNAFILFCVDKGFEIPFVHTNYYVKNACVYTRALDGGSQKPSVVPRWPARGDLSDFSIFEDFKPEDIRPPEGVDPGLWMYMWNQFEIDHEIGHIITNEDLPPRDPHDLDCIATVISENTADLYGVIRNCQRFDNYKGFVQSVIEWRYINLVLHNDHGHHTVPALRQIKEMNKNDELKGLTLKETRELSLKIAKKHYHNARMNKVFERNFSKIVSKARKQGNLSDIETIKKIAERGAKSQFYEVKEAVRAYLKWAEDHFPASAITGFDFDQARSRINTPQPPALKRIFSFMAPKKSLRRSGSHLTHLKV